MKRVSSFLTPAGEGGGFLLLPTLSRIDTIFFLAPAGQQLLAFCCSM
nr:hypothetical protein [Brevibacillus laterosporus]